MKSVLGTLGRAQEKEIDISSSEGYVLKQI